MDLAILAVAVFVFGYGIVSRRLASWWVSGPMVFVVLGWLAGDSGLGVLDLGVGNTVLLALSEATLGVVLFADAVRIDLSLLRHQLLLPVRLLAIGLPLTILAGTVVAAAIFTDLPWAEAGLMAAMLAPTDAALGQAVLTNRAVPVRIRQALNVESGLNDGIAVPVVTVVAALAVAEAVAGPRDWVIIAAEDIGFGALFGVGCGFVGGWLVRATRSKGWIDGVFLQLSTLAVPVVAYMAADMAGGSGFIATFAAGLVFGALVRHAAAVDFTEDLGQLLSMVTFLLFGAVLVGPAIDAATVQVVLYALLSLTVVRMVPVALALIGTGSSARTVAFLGWFGPRGLASILFVLVVVEEAGLPGGDELTTTVTLTVLLSLFLHGLSAHPLSDRYARATAAAHVPEEAMEMAPVPEIRVRTYMPDVGG